MDPKKRYDRLYEKAMKPLPNYQDVIRKAYIEALKQAKRP